jgi:hypothetical protein
VDEGGGGDGDENENGNQHESRGKRAVKCVVDSTGALRVYFSHRADAFRALGRLMIAAHNAPFGAKPGAQAALAAGMQFEETPWLELMGVQLDCSRGGVPHVAALQDWAVQLSLYGFNALLMYMEDVYEVGFARLTRVVLHSKHQLMTASMVHATNLTPGSANPGTRCRARRSSDTCAAGTARWSWRRWGGSLPPSESR